MLPAQPTRIPTVVEITCLFILQQEAGSSDESRSISSKISERGAFSQVAKATVKNINDQEVITVAVKMLKGYGKLYFNFKIKALIVWLWVVANITPALTG